jgi:hypothetical protein
MNSASICSLAGRYDNPIPTLFLAPIDCLKIPAQLLRACLRHQWLRKAWQMDADDSKALRMLIVIWPCRKQAAWEQADAAPRVNQVGDVGAAVLEIDERKPRTATAMRG